MEAKHKLLLVSNLYYPAQGREYFREDIELSRDLRKTFQVWISHMDDIEPLLHAADAILVRNTGPQGPHREKLIQLRKDRRLVLSNDLKGKGDILGKQHLVDLFKEGYPVIPTVGSINELHLLGGPDKYLLKPIDGCDSAGVKILRRSELQNFNCDRFVIQPLVEFEHEVSFYFVDDVFHYALFAPDPSMRWKLELFSPSREEVQFARRFIEWNSCRHGIQRVDACRLKTGDLALMELEDYNPYLSLSQLTEKTRNSFIDALCSSVIKQIRQR